MLIGKAFHESLDSIIVQGRRRLIDLIDLRIHINFVALDRERNDHLYIVCSAEVSHCLYLLRVERTKYDVAILCILF